MITRSVGCGHKKESNMIRKIYLQLLFLLLLPFGMMAQRHAKKELRKLLADTAVATGHLGLLIYDVEKGEYLIQHNADKYFLPASNTKILSLYAGLKYLGDSIVGMQYELLGDSAIQLYPSGDPTFLHRDYKAQPVLEFLKANKSKNFYISGQNFKSYALGYGWAWDDYSGSYMVERSAWPVYGNTAKVNLRHSSYANQYFTAIEPASIFGVEASNSALPKVSFERLLRENKLLQLPASANFKSQEIPFLTFGIESTGKILSSELGLSISLQEALPKFSTRQLCTIKTQPLDSLLRTMMHQSDNFFAEQILQMASYQFMGYMDEQKLIDTLAKTHLKNLPQRIKWVDGSGLSRYNLITPQSMLEVLLRLHDEFGLARLKNIFATGGQGTISNYYKKYSGRIFAKTGTLSNNCALSGYLVGKSGKLYVFSVFNNNYITSATPVRKAVEKFLTQVMERY